MGNDEPAYNELIRNQMKRNDMQPAMPDSGIKPVPVPSALNPHPKPTTPSSQQKIKLLLIPKGRVLIKPSNKVISTFLSAIPNSTYNPKDNEWEFDVKHYKSLVNEMKCNRIVFDPIPPGTISLALRFISSETFSLQGGIYDRLISFQRQAVEYALNRNGRVLLADDMGLGKTVQALAIANYYKSEFPLLVVAPASLLDNWKESISRFLGIESTIIRGKPDFADQVAIISYNLAVSFIDIVKAKRYGVVICDECHYLKSMTSKRTKSLLPVLQAASRLVMVSGTPATSRPLELYPIIMALDKTAYPAFTVYGNRYCNGRKVGNFYDYKGCSNASELSLALEHAFMIRRLKNLVMSELPKKSRRHIVLTVKNGTRGQAKHDYFGEIAEQTVMAEFTEAAGIKKEAVLKYIEETVVDKKIKTVVFAHHAVMLDGIEEFCRAKKIGYMRIDGSTAAGKRAGLVDSFQNSDAVRIAVLSLTACSTGLTLTAGKAVVFAELYWNPGTLLQAEDRIHRIGQTDSVDIHYLIGKNTVDEVVWPHILKKLTVLESLGIGNNELKNARKETQDKKQVATLDKYL